MPLEEVTSEDIQKHLALLQDPERVIEKLHKIVEIDALIVGLRPLVRRRFEIPISATFWDLYVAIQNVFGWRSIAPTIFSVSDPYFERPVALSGPLLWNTKIRKYMFKEYQSCKMAAQGELIQVTIKRRDDPLPGRTYPHCLGGENPSPPESTEPVVVLERMFEDPQNFEATLRSDSNSDRPFDPREVRFDNPEEVWIEYFYEQRVTAEALEKVLSQQPKDEVLYLFPLVFPAWFGDLLIRDQLVPPEVLSKVRDDSEHPGFIVLAMSRREIANLMDTIQVKQFQSQDLRLNRRLEHLMYDLRCARFVMDDRPE